MNQQKWQMFVHKLPFRVLLFVGLMAPGENGTLASGQILHATGDRPSFEVATIKEWRRTPSPPPDGASLSSANAPVKVMKVAPGNAGPPPSDRLHMILPISILIASAYNLPVDSRSRILGGPDWLRQDIDEFEIQARSGTSSMPPCKK